MKKHVGKARPRADKKPWDDLFGYDDEEIHCLVTFAQLANVTEDLQDFLEVIASCINPVWVGWKTLGREHAGSKNVEDAASAIRTARSKIEALSSEQKLAFAGAFATVTPAWFERHLDEIAPDGNYDKVAADIIRLLDEAFGVMVGRSFDHSPPSRRGRPKGSLSEWPLRYFIGELLAGVESYSGTLPYGKIGQTNKAQGRLVEALALLKPLLPPGFITPSIGVYSFLHEVVEEHRRLMEGAARVAQEK